jgi:hypothetical protein
MPQLALQHSMPVLQVLIPHVTLIGYSMPPLHGVVSHSWPGRTQRPQLALQQT